LYVEGDIVGVSFDQREKMLDRTCPVRITWTVSTKVSRVNKKSVRVRRDDRLQINDLLGVFVAEAPFSPSSFVTRKLKTDITLVE
jgi:hypothetical protein